MGSGSDESIYWILTMVITLSYHYYKVATHNGHYKLPLTAISQLTNLSRISFMYFRHGLHRKHLFRCIVGRNVYRSVAQQQVMAKYSILLPAFAATRMFSESLLSNDDIPLLLHVWTCLPSYCLATIWSNPLQYYHLLRGYCTWGID
jgi:hypothetical protein